jgi:hypothetical protein
MTNLVKSGTVESKFILNINGLYIYRSATAYDYKNDLVDFTIGNENGDEFGRFETLESALLEFNRIANA